MAADTEDDALSWAGETDPSHVAGPTPAPAVAPRTEIVVDKQAKPQVSSLLLISYGVLAGAYLIYTIGWVVALQRYAAQYPISTDPLTAIMFGVTEFLAIASPVLWLGAVLLLTRGRKPIVRLLWLLIGLAAVVPWPFVLGAWN